MKYETIFISDVHLGTKVCQGEMLLEFLKETEVKKVYLLGDIIDIVAMKKRVFWPTSHNDVIKRLFKLAKKGVEIVYIPGNHDYIFRAYDGENFGGIQILKKDIHITKSGKRVLLKHGDEFDGVIRNIGWLYHLGDFMYDKVIKMNKPINRCRRILGYKYNWSFSLFLKTKVKESLKFISHFEKLLVAKAREYGVDAVMCGHIHKAEISQHDEITYYNTGCWTEFCSFIAEDEKGELHLHYYERDLDHSSNEEDSSEQEDSNQYNLIIPPLLKEKFATEQVG